MKTIEENSISLIRTFQGVIESLNTREKYEASPPQGPPETWEVISTDDQFDELNLTTFGEDRMHDKPYVNLELLNKEEVNPKKIEFPTAETISDLNICAIDGSNERVEKGAFFFILARAAIVNFRYSKEGLRPYFYQKLRDASAVTLADYNIFNYDRLNISTEYNLEENENEIRRYLNNNLTEPLFINYQRNKNNKSPSSHAVGWGVKIMQTLELMSLKDVKTDQKCVCIKDGPIFSPSVSAKDTIKLLKIIKTWEDQILVGCSKRIKDSRLLVQLLLKKGKLRKHWFENQNITDNTIRGISSDSIILPRILKPGERTPLIIGTPIARQKIVDPNSEQRGDSDFTPISCYYLSRTKPHTYLRLEIPYLFYNKNPHKVEEAISIVAWQHELGRIAPLVQILADKRCKLTSEKIILERQTEAALREKQLEFLQDY
ncbi:MAG: hypothetical protein DWQ02_17815 [Bacteroidetes bacterium]|nr:MAG: hypothetical protein DWQ02_17815 [Bacteroidota bacterium]